MNDWIILAGLNIKPKIKFKRELADGYQTVERWADSVTGPGPAQTRTQRQAPTAPRQGDSPLRRLRQPREKACRFLTRP